jgi:hypothetical protein
LRCVGDQRPALVQPFEQRRRLAVNELRTEFQRYGYIGLAAGEDASANTVARFEHANALAGGSQLRRRGQARDAGADDQCVESRRV